MLSLPFAYFKFQKWKLAVIVSGGTLKSEIRIKDTRRENTPSNKTEALTNSMNMHIWTIGTLNQLFIRGSCY